MLSLEAKKQIIDLDIKGVSRVDIQSQTGYSPASIIKVLNNKKRVLAIGDLHCGHMAGLTPTKYQVNDDQEEIWDWFKSTVRLLKPDILIVNGDAVEGKGRRSGGTELIENTWTRQTDMAIQVVNTVNAKKNYFTYGTPYHTGDEEDYELLIANACRGYITGHLFLEVNGLNFDVKHKVGASTIPHGRSTAVKKDVLWNTLWAERDQQPTANILLRSHVHYHDYAGKKDSLAMTLPALQGWGSKFGVRQCSGIVDTGLVWFDIREGDTVDTMVWHADLPKFKCQTINTILIKESDNES